MASITQLEYAVAVDRFRHFAKAAQSCNVSQPTLSQQIQKLEDEMGIILFDRLHKPMVVTPEGQRFIDQAKTVLREHQRLLHLTHVKSGGVSGIFRLAVIPTLSSFVLPKFIPYFSKKYPDVELFIEESKTEHILEGLKNDQIDGAIMATPLADSGYKEHPLFYEPMYLFLSADHQLLKKETIYPSDISGSQMWQLKDGNCFKTQVAQYCAIVPGEETVFKNIHFQSGSLETLVKIVEEGDGYTMIPALMLATMPAHKIKKHVREFARPFPAREISFVYRRDHWKLEIIESLKQSVQATLPKELSESKPENFQVLEICE